VLEEAIREVGQALDDAIAEALAHAPSLLVKLDITANYAVKYFLFDFSVDRFSCVHFYYPFETKFFQSINISSIPESAPPYSRKNSVESRGITAAFRERSIFTGS